MGNLTNKMDNNVQTNYSANNLNQMTGIGAQTLTYDAKENLLTRPGWSYTWNAKNQLVIVETANPQEGSKKMTFFYDGRNRCVKRRTYTYTSGSWALTSDTCLYYDGWNLMEERDGGGNIFAAFANGPVIDEMLAKFTSTNTVFFHGDAQNSTLALSDANGGVLERYRYEAFGMPYIYDSQFNGLSTSAYGIRHLFQGREWLADLKLSDHRNRYYLPEVQRWLNRDPIEEFGGFNLYCFNLNNAGSLIDPFGLCNTGGCPPGMTLQPDPDCARRCHTTYILQVGAASSAYTAVLLSAAITAYFGNVSLSATMVATASATYGTALVWAGINHDICVANCPKQCRF